MFHTSSSTTNIYQSIIYIYKSIIYINYIYIYIYIYIRCSLALCRDNRLDADGASAVAASLTILECLNDLDLRCPSIPKPLLPIPSSPPSISIH